MLLDAFFCQPSAPTNNWPGIYLQHIVPMTKRGEWKLVHFDVLNPKMQEFGLNKTIYWRSADHQQSAWHELNHLAEVVRSKPGRRR